MSDEIREPLVPLPKGIVKAGTVSVSPDGVRTVSHFHFDGVDMSAGGELAITWGAACLLHGRITWEMVDACRDGAARLAWTLPGATVPDLTRLADLLESLLPPRAP